MTTCCVYFIRPVGQLGPIKIGHSSDVRARLNECKGHSPVPLELVAELPVEEGDGRRICQLHMERRFHVKYAANRLHREWFEATPELLADIDAINAGTFDPQSLPTPYWRAA